MENKTFEELYQELEILVKKLENKDTDLLESVDIYVKALELAKILHIKLNDSEQLVLNKMTENGIKPLDIKDNS